MMLMIVWRERVVYGVLVEFCEDGVMVLIPWYSFFLLDWYYCYEQIKK